MRVVEEIYSGVETTIHRSTRVAHPATRTGFRASLAVDLSRVGAPLIWPDCDERVRAGRAIGSRVSQTVRLD